MLETKLLYSLGPPGVISFLTTLEVFSGACQMRGTEIVMGKCPNGNAQTGSWQHLTLSWAWSLQESKEDITELDDGFKYALNIYGGPVDQAANTTQCRSEVRAVPHPGS